MTDQVKKDTDTGENVNHGQVQTDKTRTDTGADKNRDADKGTTQRDAGDETQDDAKGA